MSKLADLYKSLKNALGNDLEARMILQDYAALSWTDIMTQPDKVVAPDICAKIDVVLKRRLNGEPLSRIAGVREFYGRNFKLGPATLDPRPDTEVLIDAALKYKPPQSILDLGTGTGCILLTLLAEWPQAQGVAVDLSQDALAIAQENAEALGVAERATFVQSNWWENIEGRYDLIVSNPPYIPNRDIANLDKEVREHDPILALEGGDEGYDAYKIILSKLNLHLNDGGVALFEIGINQCGYISRIAGEAGFAVDSIHPDLAGIPRVVEISRGDK